MEGSKSLQIVGISLQGGSGHEHVAHLLWQGQRSAGVTAPEGVIRWLREDPEHEAWLVAGERRVAVEVVTPIGGPSHLRSRTDGQWGDALLKLPRF
jgi:hypothetical protein